MLLLAQSVIFLAGLTGILFLIRKQSSVFLVSRILSVAAMLSQAAWLIYAGFSFPYSVLLDPWGVMAVFIIAVIAMSFWAGKKYQTPQVLIGALVLLSLAIILGRVFFPAPGNLPIKITMKLALHILFTSAGFAILAVGCVVGILILLRTRILKSMDWAFKPEIPWPSLTALDNLFFKTLGLGILLLSVGIGLGAWLLPGMNLKGTWYEDPKVLLSSLGWGLYGWVWVSRRRQGFYSWTIVAIATLGYIFILLGFFLSNFIATGFHRF